MYRNPGTPPGGFLLEQNVPTGSADRQRNKVFTDILQGSVSFNIMSKYGVQAEEIADHVFYALTGYRDELKKKGIHKLSGLRISDERILKQGSDIEVAVISISCNFLMQKSVSLASRQYNLRVFVDGKEKKENIHFKILPDGSSLEFKDAPSEDAEILINFVEAITLEHKTGVSPVENADGQRRIFTLPNG
jgi:hypothetical protein